MKINFTLFAAVAFFLGLAGCAEAQPGKITTFGAPMLTRGSKLNYQFLPRVLWMYNTEVRSKHHN
jgi:hypothetical protein